MRVKQMLAGLEGMTQSDMFPFSVLIFKSLDVMKQ